MKKFDEFKILGVGGMMIQGHEHTELLQQLMQNQNEIIDWIFERDDSERHAAAVADIKEKNREIERRNESNS